MDPGVARTHLEEERERLESIRSRLNDIHTESEEDSLGESTAGQHMGDVGTETFEREKDLSLLEEVEAELELIERAMGRIDEGTYGVCEACGKPIADERLEAMPATRFCLEDQALAERE